MFLPFGFVKNALAAKAESKRKIGFLQTEDGEVMELVVDTLTASNIMCFIRLQSIMYHGRLRGTIYRIYIAESAYQKAKMALMESELDFRDVKLLNVY